MEIDEGRVRRLVVRMGDAQPKLRQDWKGVKGLNAAPCTRASYFECCDGLDKGKVSQVTNLIY